MHLFLLFNYLWLQFSSSLNISFLFEVIKILSHQPHISPISPWWTHISTQGFFFLAVLKRPFATFNFKKRSSSLAAAPLWPWFTHLLQQLRSHTIGAVEDDEELLVFLQLFEERSGVRVPGRELTDLDPQVKLCRSFD